MSGEGVVRTVKRRIFVPGTPTKGKILQCFNQQEPNHLAFKLDARKYMDSKYWEAAERDYTPGYYIEIEAEFMPVKAVSIDDSAEMRDGRLEAPGATIAKIEAL